MSLLTSRPELENLPPGWFHHGAEILALLEQYKPLVTVEIGSWQGASAIAMARVVRGWDGVIFCVDTWTGEGIHGGLSTDGVTYAATTSDEPTMIARCAANLVAAGVAASVRLIPAPSLEAAKWWIDTIDCLYIDADHSYSAVLADLEAWVPMVKPGGIILGDDYGNVCFPGVRQAWQYWALEHDVELRVGVVGRPECPQHRLVWAEVW